MMPRDRRTAKIVFWCVSPIMFAGLVRLFFLFFYFGLGMFMLWLLGARHHAVIFWSAIVLSSGFTIAALVILYRLFKTRLLEES